LLLFPTLLPASEYSLIAISIIDLLFIPAVAFVLAYPIIVNKQWRNLIFIPILILLFIENLIMHLGLWLNTPTISFDAAWAGVFTVVMLISVMGGRVIPFFTAKATATNQPSAILLLELLANLPILIVITYFIATRPDFVSNQALVIIFSTAAFFQLIRFARWRFWLCFKNPLLWSLHASYLFIPLGLTLLALHFAGFNVSQSQALHSLTVGAIGGLILAMMARVSLGHTGRKLQTLRGMGIAFMLMILAGIFRSPLAAFDLLSPMMSLKLSFVFFILAYSIFLRRYIPILLQRRIDGRTG